MKKKLSYRDKLLELAYIYNVKEIKEYIKNKKNLTTGQLELILKKNKIVIPKDFKTSLVKDNLIKPISKFKNNFAEFKENNIKLKNRFIRKTENFKYDIQRKIGTSIKNIWNNLGIIGLNFLNIIPTIGQTFYKFFTEILVEFFSGIYNQQINPKKARSAIVGFSIISLASVLIVSSVFEYNNDAQIQKVEIKKPIVKEKKEEKKPKFQVKKKEKKKKLQIKKKKNWKKKTKN